MKRSSSQRWTVALTLTVIGILLLAAPVLAHAVKFHNSSGHTITEFYSKRSGSGDWGRDILGNGVRETGQYLTLSHNNQCQRDLGLRLDGEWWIEFNGVDLCGDLSDIDLQCDADGCNLLYYYD